VTGSIRLTTIFEWQPLGEIDIDIRSRLAFPKAPSKPGLYRFGVDQSQQHSVYIGETDQLPRRFQHYRTPGPSQQTNLRLNALFLEVLKTHGKISVSIVTHASIEMTDGPERPADLSKKWERVLLEHSAICTERSANVRLLNA